MVPMKRFVFYQLVCAFKTVIVVQISSVCQAAGWFCRSGFNQL